VKLSGWLNNNLSALSSGGVSESGGTLDVVAPGDLNWALCTPDPAIYQACTNFAGKPADVELSGGTSEAGPLTAGTAALVIQAYREAHKGQTPTPAIVKQIIISTAEDVAGPADEQGAGMIDAYAAVLAARSYAGATVPPAGHELLSSTNQLDVAGATNSPESLADTITNDGSGPVTVKLSSRTLAPYTNVKSVSLDLTSTNNYEAVEKLTVPAGEGRLETQVAYTSSSNLSTGPGSVNITLYGPGKRLAAFSLEQGTGDAGQASVADPSAGTWTAQIEGGAPSTVQFGAQVAPWTSLGTVSPSTVTLQAGASSTAALSIHTAATPGDESGALVLQSSATGSPNFTTTTTVPVILRSYVPTPDPTTTFTGTLTGGNGRSTDTGQSAYYVVDLPAGDSTLSADISTANSANTFTAELVSPSGLAASTAANSLGAEATSGLTLVPEVGSQLHVVAPVPGLWTLAINFYNQVSGTALDQPFTVTMSTAPPPASATGLPNSAGTDLTAGHSYTAEVKVTNKGNTPEEYFVDPRLNASVTVSLVPLTTAAATIPNLTAETTPTYLVPTGTSSVTASVASPKPAFFDFDDIFGDPDVIAGTPGHTDNPTGTFNATSPAVPEGVWAVVPYLDGPDGVKGYRTTTVQTAMSATTQAFDSAVTSSTGDLWESSVNSSNGVTPVMVEPGETVDIAVTITPNATAGSTVAGTLYLDDDSSIPEVAANTLSTAGGILPDGSQLAAFPYEYTVTAG
jgi:hypothetical protein